MFYLLKLKKVLLFIPTIFPFFFWKKKFWKREPSFIYLFAIYFLLKAWNTKSSKKKKKNWLINPKIIYNWLDRILIKEKCSKWTIPRSSYWLIEYYSSPIQIKKKKKSSPSLSCTDWWRVMWWAMVMVFNGGGWVSTVWVVWFRWWSGCCFERGWVHSY